MLLLDKMFKLEVTHIHMPIYIYTFSLYIPIYTYVHMYALFPVRNEG